MKSMNWKIGIFVFASYLGIASAAPVAVLEAPLDTPSQQVTADFGINRELGRAWVEVRLEPIDSLGDTVPAPRVIARQVDGLYYDRARKQVLYQLGSEVIVCAEDSNFLWFTSSKSTGKCLLTASREQRTVDDGFGIHEQAVSMVLLDLETAGGSQHAAVSKRE